MKAPVSIYLGNSKLYQYPRPVDDGMENEVDSRYTLDDTFELILLKVYEVYKPKLDYINLYEFKLHKYKNVKYVIKVIPKFTANLDIKLIHNIQVVNNVFNTYSKAKELYDSIIKQFNKGHLEFNLI